MSPPITILGCILFDYCIPPFQKIVCMHTLHCPHVCAQHGSEVVVVTQTGARWVSASMTLYDIVRHSVTNDAFCDNYQCDGSLWQIHTISFCGAIIDCAGWDRSPEYNVSGAPIINSFVTAPAWLHVFTDAFWIELDACCIDKEWDRLLLHIGLPSIQW